MQSNPPPRGKWQSSRQHENSNPQKYNPYIVDRNEAPPFRPAGSGFNVNQTAHTDGARGGLGSTARNQPGSLRPRYPDAHGTPAGAGAAMVSQGSPFQHAVPAPRHAGGGVPGDGGSGISLPPPRSAQLMAASGAAGSYTSSTYAMRSAPAPPPPASRWPTAGAPPSLHAPLQGTATGPAAGMGASGSLYTRLADSSAPKAAARDTGALSYAVSDGDGMCGATRGLTLGSPGNVGSVTGNTSRNDNLADISALLMRVDESRDQAIDTHGVGVLTDPMRAEGRFDVGARREPSAFTFTTSSEFSTALYPGGAASGPNAVASLSTVPNAFSTRPDASSTGSFHSPFSTGPAAAPATSTPLFSVQLGGNDGSRNMNSAASGPSQRPVDNFVASSFTTGPALQQHAQQHLAQGGGEGLFSSLGFQHSDGGESSEGEGLLDFRAVLGSPSAEPEGTPTATLAPVMDEAPLHIDPTTDTSCAPKPTMAETLFKHATKPTNVIPTPPGSAMRPEPAASKATSTATQTPTNSSTKPNTPPSKLSLAAPGQQQGSHERASVPAPRSAERTSATSAPRSTGREDGSLPSRTSTLPQSPHLPGTTRPQRLPLESPTVTRHNIARLFRDSPQSQRHREIMEQNRQKPTALHNQPQWPPTNPVEVEALLKKTNAGKLLRHLAIICFSRQNVKGVQELFDTWTRNGIPAPDLGFGAYYYYVKERSEKLLCMKHNGRGATPGHGYGKCDFESRRPNSTCRYEHVCLFCRSREHGWFEESRCEGYQQLLAEVERLGVSEEDLEVMLDAMEKPTVKQASWIRRS